MYCPTENDALSTAKRRDIFRKPSEMKTQPELQVAVAPEILPTAYCRGDFHPKRNPQPCNFDKKGIATVAMKISALSRVIGNLPEALPRHELR